MYYIFYMKCITHTYISSLPFFYPLSVVRLLSIVDAVGTAAYTHTYRSTKPIDIPTLARGGGLSRIRSENVYYDWNWIWSSAINRTPLINMHTHKGRFCTISNANPVRQLINEWYERGNVDFQQIEMERGNWKIKCKKCCWKNVNSNDWDRCCRFAAQVGRNKQIRVDGKGLTA